MKMPKTKPMKPLGSFEEDVLLAIGALERTNEASGANIRGKVETMRKMPISAGALYATLDRLERKDLITSYEMPPSLASGGRTRRIFQILRAGKIALQASESRREKVRQEWLLGKA
jgi:PadR family transcriptional regulator, regulatory protein PadR